MTLKDGSIVRDTRPKMPQEEVAQLVDRWRDMGVLLRYDQSTGNVELGATVWADKSRVSHAALEKAVEDSFVELRKMFRRRMGYAVENQYALGIGVNVEVKLGWTENLWKFDARAVHISGEMDAATARKVADDFSTFMRNMGKMLGCAPQKTSA